MEWLFIILTVTLAGFRYASIPIALLFSLLTISSNKVLIFLIGIIVSGFIWYNVYDLIWFLVLDITIPAHILFISGVLALFSHIIQIKTMEELTKVAMSSEVLCIFLFGLIRWLGLV